jgi:hypothetical protein
VRKASRASRVSVSAIESAVAEDYRVVAACDMRYAAEAWRDEVNEGNADAGRVWVMWTIAKHFQQRH